MQAFYTYFEILLGSEQLQYFGLTVCKTKIILKGDEIRERKEVRNYEFQK